MSDPLHNPTSAVKLSRQAAPGGSALGRRQISLAACEETYQRHVVQKFRGEGAHAGSGQCVRCGRNVTGELAVAFNETQAWDEEGKR